MSYTDPRALLAREFRETLSTASLFASIGLVTIAVGTAVCMVRGIILSDIAYPVFGLCSTALIGIGVIRAGKWNFPTLAGTLAAILTAGIILAQAIAGLPMEQWIIPAYLSYFALISIWSVVMIGSLPIMDALQREQSWGWYWLGTAGVIAWLMAPFAVLMFVIVPTH